MGCMKISVTSVAGGNGPAELFFIFRVAYAYVKNVRRKVVRTKATWPILREAIVDILDSCRTSYSSVVFVSSIINYHSS